MLNRLTFIAFLAFGFTLSAAEPKGSGLGPKILAYCKENLGKKVGGGECAHLASESLKEVGGKLGEKDSPNEGDYVWGTLTVTVEADAKGPKFKGAIGDVKPGDIIQLRDAKFEGRKGRGNYWSAAPHHTAIVKSVDTKLKTIQTYEQNMGGKRFVQEGAYNLNDLKAGWLRFYRPELK